MMKGNHYICFIGFLKIFLGMLFLYAAIDKIVFPASFAEVIYHYRLVPLGFLNISAIIIPWIEIGIGVLLLLDVWSEVASFILILLTFAFVVMIASAMVRGLNIECGCFSLDSHNSFVGWKRIIEDLLMIAGGCLILQFEYKKHPSGNGSSSI
ncbi:MAG: DoxX family membrane protein [Candidatus Marinimicrobia bacterium]|nr:DoxX family membrane protein [Candidatus Neomarinimicrobiota bacterium]